MGLAEQQARPPPQIRRYLRALKALAPGSAKASLSHRGTLGEQYGRAPLRQGANCFRVKRCRWWAMARPDVSYARCVKIIHLVDGTYELFRHFYGLRRFTKVDRPLGAVTGVLNSVLELIEQGETHVGATDHVVESFRNALWSGYKTSAGIEQALLAQFEPLEDALTLMGATVWPMTELEADDALAAAAQRADASPVCKRSCIWTPDKDLAQCVRTHSVVRCLHRRRRTSLSRA